MSSPHDQDQRRQFWTRQMDLAHQFMLQIEQHPVNECGEAFVPLKDAAAAGGVEVWFSDSPIVEGLDRLFFLREGLIPPFLAAARDMNQRGWIMKVEDGYRTRAMQKRLATRPSVFDAILGKVIWECAGKLPDAEFLFRRAGALIAYCPKVGTHMSGSAIDISVFDRAAGNEISRGGPYLEMSELTPMDSPFVDAQARQNRAQVTAIMRRRGFMPYPYEFWHYNQGDAYDECLNQTGRPARYGAVDWDPATNHVTPIENPRERLNRREEIEAAIEAALRRRGN